jgi:hypothetical protein
LTKRRLLSYLPFVPTVANPFFYESPTSVRDFTDREALLSQLNQLMSERGRRLLIFGRRRMGKTSLIRRAGSGKGRRFILCDITTAASLNELAKKLLEAAPEQKGNHLTKALERAGKYLKSVAVSAGKIVITGELRASEGEHTLEQVLNYLNDSADSLDEAWNICLDEFQEIRRLGGEKVDWRLRSIIQDHKSLNYIFTGSDHRLIGWMTDPTAPFFKQLAQMEVGPIDPGHMADWIKSRARIGGLPDFPHGPRIVALAGPCTGDIVKLAKTVFDLQASKPSGDLVATAFDAIALTELNQAFLNLWRPLGMTERAVLRAIAAGKLPTAAGTLREYGINAPSTAANGIENLVNLQFLVRFESALIFDSPFFRRWVDFNGA